MQFIIAIYDEKVIQLRITQLINMLAHGEKGFIIINYFLSKYNFRGNLYIVIGISNFKYNTEKYILFIY